MALWHRARAHEHGDFDLHNYLYPVDMNDQHLTQIYTYLMIAARLRDDMFYRLYAMIEDRLNISSRRFVFAPLQQVLLFSKTYRRAFACPHTTI